MCLFCLKIHKEFDCVNEINETNETYEFQEVNKIVSDKLL